MSDVVAVVEVDVRVITGAVVSVTLSVFNASNVAVSYTHLTLPTNREV